MADEQGGGFPPDVAGQKRWAKQLVRQACDMLDRAKQGHFPTDSERLGYVNGLRFAFRRAAELGFTSELQVLMLARGIHVLGKEDD